MKFIIGLGNPGQKYLHTRHNIGFKVVDQMAGDDQKWNKSNKGKLEYLWLERNGEKIELIKPQTFMNKSGLVFAYIRKTHPQQFTGENLFVIHDDLDLEVGKFKLQFGKGPKQHNGLTSIYQHLGTDQFWHVRIGIDGRQGDRTIASDEYVLSFFRPDERLIIEQVVHQIIAELQQRIDSYATN
ncbi:MAG: aminoacyl-tRNA hydrolase [Patescibacteria group bacterium]